ncbi:MAG: hypothetical protein FWH10_00080 [Oscillospiraceae bacterium]|nr:hypothetical protein [Oscillospiraceae bacterium]
MKKIFSSQKSTRKGVKFMTVWDLLFLMIYFSPDFIEPAKFIIQMIKNKRRLPPKD